LCSLWIGMPQIVQSLVNGKELIIGSEFLHLGVVQRQSTRATALFDSLAPPGLFDQDSAHGLGGSAKEMGPICEMSVSGRADKAQVGFMDKRCRVQRVLGPFTSHLSRRQLAQFVVNQWQQLLSGVRIALFDVR
jgi:hypothetical protein